LYVIFYASLKIPAAHMSGETTAHQEHALYTELSKREPGMIVDILCICIFYTYKTISQ
jgi:hypothetical protein